MLRALRQDETRALPGRQDIFLEVLLVDRTPDLQRPRTRRSTASCSWIDPEPIRCRAWATACNNLSGSGSDASTAPAEFSPATEPVCAFAAEALASEDACEAPVGEVRFPSSRDRRSMIEIVATTTMASRPLISLSLGN